MKFALGMGPNIVPNQEYLSPLFFVVKSIGKPCEVDFAFDGDRRRGSKVKPHSVKFQHSTGSIASQRFGFLVF